LRIYEDIVDKLWFIARLIGDFLSGFFIIISGFYHHQTDGIAWPCIYGLCALPSGDDRDRKIIVSRTRGSVEKVGQFTTVMQETIIKFIAIVITIVIMVISTTMVKVSIQETRSRNHYSFKKLFNKKNIVSRNCSTNNEVTRSISDG
jgi:hypothetical protein